eukprot:7005018-Prymnesium_polylepis.1
MRLRSSTAPSESTPASISGASPSTEPPATLLTMSITSLTPIAGAVGAERPRAGAALRAGAVVPRNLAKRRAVG